MKCAECNKERKCRKWCWTHYLRGIKAGTIQTRRQRNPRPKKIVAKADRVVKRGRPRKRDERFISFLVSVIVGKAQDVGVGGWILGAEMLRFVVSRMENYNATLAGARLISCNNEGPHGVAKVFRPRHTVTASKLVRAFCVLWTMEANALHYFLFWFASASFTRLWRCIEMTTPTADENIWGD